MRRLFTTSAVLGIGLVGLYEIVTSWMAITATQAKLADFTAVYAAANLWLDHGGSSLYDLAWQRVYFAQTVAPDAVGFSRFIWAPPATLLAAPFASLPLFAAYRAFSLLQLMVVLAAMALVFRFAPWPKTISRFERIGLTVFATSSVGLWYMFHHGQIDSTTALGVALALVLWSKRKLFWGALALTVLAGLAKPHLALGMAAFLIGWRQRRALLGAAWGIALLLLASFVVGTNAISGFVNLILGGESGYLLRTHVGLSGLVGSFFGDTALSSAMALAGIAVCLLLCGWIGFKVSREPELMPVGFITAVALSVFATFHLNYQDLVILSPMLLWALAIAAGKENKWPGKGTLALLTLWMLVSAINLFEMVVYLPAPPGQLLPWPQLLFIAGGFWAIHHWSSPRLSPA